MRNFNKPFIYSLVFLLIFLLQSCDLIVGIFEAGFWVGIILSAIVVFLVIWLIVKVLKALRR